MTREVERTSAVPFDFIAVARAARLDESVIGNTLVSLGGQPCCFCGNFDARHRKVILNVGGDNGGGVDSTISLCNRCEVVLSPRVRMSSPR